MSFDEVPQDQIQKDGPAGGEELSLPRRVMALDLLSLFTKAFPEITYDLAWESRSVNAQAWLSGKNRHVVLYGGLIRHRRLSSSGLALALAHETGHHLGGRPLDPELRWPTWQGQADYWAARTAMPRVFGTAARATTLRGARELVRLTRRIGQDADLSAEERLRIWYAGAMDRPPPVCMRKAFDRVLLRRRRA
jgi:hypothetical protein